MRALVEVRHRTSRTDKRWLPIEMAALRGEMYQLFEFLGRLEQLTEVPFALPFTTSSRTTGMPALMHVYVQRGGCGRSGASH